jgi:hydrogenase/urease accessory protein HupE
VRFPWRRAACCLLLFGPCSAPTLEAHEVRPAYLRLKSLDDQGKNGLFDVLWRKPVGGEVRLDIVPVLPAHCANSSDAVTWVEAGIEASHWTVTCPGGIDGHRIVIGGLTATVTDVLVRYERSSGTTQVVRLTPDEPSFEVRAAETWLEVSATYFVLGTEHILLGIDHLLFVVALLMLVAGWRTLVATITSFTLAHSATLAAATLGWVAVPQQPIEAVIALSIVFVATEIVRWRQGSPGVTQRAPWIVAFAFGLLHGFGFAGALADIGVPGHAIPSALLFFNLGVEAGQLLFVACVLLVWSVLRRVEWSAALWRVPVYGIGALAAFWSIERLVAFGTG